MIGVEEVDYTDAKGAYKSAMKDEGIKVGTKVARIARVIRLVRLIRIIKMYRHAHSFITYVKDKKDETVKERIQRKLKGEQEESKVGKKLSDLTTKRVIVLVILMMLFVPIFTINTYKEENTYFEYGLDMVNEYSSDMTSVTYITLFKSYLSEHDSIPMPITNMLVVGSMVSEFNDPDIKLDDMRPYEKELVKVTLKNVVVGVFDFTYTTKLTAVLGIIRSIFVC